MEDKNQVQEDEIDLLALLQTLWNGRKTVLKFLTVFGLLGLFVAIFSPKEYTALTMIVPVSSGQSGNSDLGGLAAIAGVKLGGDTGGGISPTLYPKIVQSIPFKKQLLETPITVSGYSEAMSFREYYRKVYSPGLLSYVKKYTIGLPRVILGWFRSKPKMVQIQREEGKIIRLSGVEYGLMQRLNSIVQLEVNDKEGYVTLSASMPEALAAAQMAEKAQELLQKNIIAFKSQKAKKQLEFVEKRYAEREKEFRKAEMALARFKDRNRNVATAIAMTEEKRLSSEYNLLYGVYSELAKKVESQKIQVKEDTPVFTVIEPVSVPMEKSKPKRAIILAIWLFLGFVIGVGVVFGKEFIKGIKENKR